MNWRKVFVPGVILLLLGAGVQLYAGLYGKITGRVTDSQTGEGLPQAAVKIEGTTMIAITDLDGYYVFLNVPPGKYTLSAQYTGYQVLRVENIEVVADRTIEVNFPLKPKEIVLEVQEIRAKEIVIRKDKTESRTLIKSEQVQSLPVTQVQEAVSYSSGVVLRGGNLYVRGGRPDEVVYVVDGVEIRDPYSNYTQSGVPLLALEEAAIDRGGFDVDQGTVSSGAISVITREGTDRYDAQMRFSTRDLSFLGNKIFNFFDCQQGDPYYDYLLNRVKNLRSYEGRWKNKERRFEFSLGGPLLPTWREGAKFFVSGEKYYTYEDYPIYTFDENRQTTSEAYQWKVTLPITKVFKIFTSGFYRWNVDYAYDPNWRLALEKLPTLRDRHLQLIGGFDLLFGKTFTELRVGYYDRFFDNSVKEDVDGDGIDDFADRDLDGFVEVDLDYFKALKMDTFRTSGRIDSIVERWVEISPDSIWRNDPRYDPSLVRYYRDKGYIELPFYWWEHEIQTLYPTIGSGPSWWPKRRYWVDPTVKDTYYVYYKLYQPIISDTPIKDPKIGRVDTVYGMPHIYKYNTYGWGQRTNIDTFALVANYETYPPTWDTLLIGNQYLPTPWTYPRVQHYIGHSKLFTAKWDLKSQVTKQHEILLGAEFKRIQVRRYAMDYASGGNIYFTLVNPDLTRRPNDPENFIDWFENHPSYPWIFAGYLRDKIEIEGMVAKIGIRFDYYSPEGYVFSDPDKPFKYDDLWGPEGVRLLNNAKKTEKKWYISPRIGVSHPISERDVLHFTYGHYYQIPPFNQLLTSYVFSGAFPIVGNPDIDPERNISYELGITHGFTENIVIDITAFYKDIFKWSRIKMFPIGVTGENYSTYVNEDYGSSRGIEVELSKRPGGAIIPNFSGSIAYTFQVARGSFSAPRNAYEWAWRGYPIPPHESPLDWDQRHKVTVTLSYTVPQGKPLFEVSGLDDINLTIVHDYGSGYPYTPPIRTLTEAVEGINSKRLPSYQNTNLRLSKGISIKNIYLSLFMDIYNIFNRKDLSSIANVDYYEYFNNPEGEERDPTVWSPRRTTRVGVEMRVKGL